VGRASGGALRGGGGLGRRVEGQSVMSTWVTGKGGLVMEGAVRRGAEVAGWCVEGRAVGGASRRPGDGRTELAAAPRGEFGG
jgi:hypothetical protein